MVIIEMNKIHITTTAEEKKNNLWKTINLRCRNKTFKNTENNINKMVRCSLTNTFCNDKNCQKMKYALRSNNDKSSNNKITK
jgi:hypothetical protein